MEVWLVTTWVSLDPTFWPHPPFFFASKTIRFPFTSSNQLGIVLNTFHILLNLIIPRSLPCHFANFKNSDNRKGKVMCYRSPRWLLVSPGLPCWVFGFPTPSSFHQGLHSKSMSEACYVTSYVRGTLVLSLLSQAKYPQYKRCAPPQRALSDVTYCEEPVAEFHVSIRKHKIP